MSNPLITRVDLSTFQPLELTLHARKQMQRRLISEPLVNIVVALGGWKLSYRCELSGDEEIFQVSNPAKFIRNALGFEIDNEEIRKLIDLTVVVSPDGRRVISTFFED